MTNELLPVSDRELEIHRAHMRAAMTYSSLSRAERKKVGAVLVRDGRILSIGWNGTPHGFDNSCETDGITKPEVLHAELNCILKVAKSTESTDGATLYTTLSCCIECAKILIGAGVTSVYFSEDYRDSSGIDLLRRAGVSVQMLEMRE